MMRHICPSIILQYSCPFLFAVQMPFSISSTDVFFYFQYRCPFPFPVQMSFFICSIYILLYLQYGCPFSISITDVLFYLQYRYPFLSAVQMSFSIYSTYILFYLQYRCPFPFPKSFAQHVLGTFTLFDDHCLWLAESRALQWMKEKKKKEKNRWRCRSVLHSLRMEYVYLLTCGRRSLVSETQNEIVVSWITLWGMIKVYWLDFSLHFRSCCLLRVSLKFGPKLASHYKPVENEVKFGLSKPYSEN